MMNEIIIGLQVLILLAIGALSFFNKFLKSYSSEKGKNLATKEDVDLITRKVEEVKSEYVNRVEHLKAELAFYQKKNDLLFGEKIRVFKKLQSQLVEFKKYCEACYGTYGRVSEFHPNLNSLGPEVGKSILFHITKIHEIEQEDFVFLSQNSRAALSNLTRTLSSLCSMELALHSDEPPAAIIQGAAGTYESAIEKIDRCLQSLFEDLEFPGKYRANKQLK
ncbi:hypothetical protein [Pseudoalteromonas sp. T1lg21]|uniref:hypothetical protein n=1 Tax=Pseudoalteromonas sp. T1lg21 TaxID=2077095 RepID=UPI000CF638E0|nr:hypothetical protein [Pseudoalteromonas sp. T1lg21]